MPTEVIKFLEITYSVILPISLAGIGKILANINKDKEEAKRTWMACIEQLNDKVDTMNKELNEHIRTSNERDVREIRIEVLDFANSCMNNRKHTQEEFEFIIQECDKYEKYCAEKNIRNGVADVAIAEVRRIYQKCFEENSFLKEGEA